LRLLGDGNEGGVYVCFLCVYLCMCIYVCMYVCMRMYIYIYVYADIYICIYIYIYMQIACTGYNSIRAPTIIICISAQLVRIFTLAWAHNATLIYACRHKHICIKSPYHRQRMQFSYA
jgi:hypothetical protein